MIAGTDRVLGELWTFGHDDVGLVIATLDRIEGTNQAGQPDLYRRVESGVYGMDDQLLTQAYMYLYESNPEHDGFTEIVGSMVSWP